MGLRRSHALRSSVRCSSSIPRHRIIRKTTLTSFSSDHTKPDQLRCFRLDPTMPAIRIDRAKRLAHEPHSGHNRYHPDIALALEVAEGEEAVLETRDALDGQLRPGAGVADLATIDASLVHPLTGPVFVKGARPGDMLEVEFVDIAPQPTAFSAIVPGLGFLRDIM